MLRTLLNKSWRQHPKQDLYGRLPITKIIKIRRTRHARHCWRSKDGRIGDILRWTPSHRRAKVGRPARIYIQQLCAYTVYNPEDLPEATDDRDEWRERVIKIRAGSATWWWWWYIYICIMHLTSTVGKVKRSGMTNHIWKEKGNHQPMCDEDKTIESKEHWRKRRLNKAAHMFGYSDLLSRPSL